MGTLALSFGPVFSLTLKLPPLIGTGAWLVAFFTWSWLNFRLNHKPVQAIADRYRDSQRRAVDLEISLDGCLLGMDSGVVHLGSGLLMFEGVRADFALQAFEATISGPPSGIGRGRKCVVRLTRSGRTFDLQFSPSTQVFADYRAIEDVYGEIEAWLRGGPAADPEVLPPLVVQPDLVLGDDPIRDPRRVILASTVVLLAEAAAARFLIFGIGPVISVVVGGLAIAAIVIAAASIPERRMQAQRQQRMFASQRNLTAKK